MVAQGHLDSLVLRTTPLTAVTDTAASKRGFFSKLMGYLNGASDTTHREQSRFGLIGGPHYDSQAGLGLGLVGTATFRIKGYDRVMQPSNITLTGDASLKGFWSLRLKGNLLFPEERMRLNFDAQLAYSPLNYWGIGFANGDNSDNKTTMKKLNFKVDAEALFKLTRGLYAGPAIEWEFNRTAPLERPELLEGDDRVVRNYGVGLVVDYDTRDYITAPTRGCYIHFSQLFKPKWLGNHYHYNVTQLTASYYHGAWRDAVIAAEVKGIFNWGGYPSWAGMAMLGDIYSMRGYYAGRYNDRHLLAAQVELRQRLWGPLGMVAWGGAGTVFNKFSSMNRLLPNGGLGLRWAFRPHVNIRIDYGIGVKGNNGFIFTVNEAF